MITNYLKTAFRNFYRHLTYTSINVLGLTIGLATSILIYLWVADEFSYEKHYDDSERIFAVVSNIRYTDGRLESGLSTTGLLADALRNDFAEIEGTARTDWGAERLLRIDQKSIFQRGVLADPSLFNVFNFEVIEGDRNNPLPDANSIVLTESTARKFFPNNDAIGKIFRVDERIDLKVTAIVRDQKQTQLQFDFLAPYELAIKESPWMLQWDNTNDKTFVKLKSGTSVDQFNSKLESYVKSKCKDCNYDVWFQNFSDTRLYNVYANGKADGGRIDYIRIFSIIGIFIVLIACINFMNLSTARSATRSREVGVRKVVGAHQKTLFFQFMGESLILAIAALTLALATVQITLPFFNSITEKQISLDFNNPSFWFTVITIVVVTGLLAGSYPSLFLSSFKPVQVLKGSSQALPSGNALRRSLVVFQFVLSIVLIICSIVVFKQVRFIKNKNLGLDRTNVVTIRMHENLKGNRDAFKAQVLQHPGITSMTFAGQDPFAISWNTSAVEWPGKAAGERISFNLLTSDKDFLNTLGITLLSGRNFEDNISDSVNYIINERARDIMGMKDPIGSMLNVWGSTNGKVIGVIKDFHNDHFEKAITPQIIMVRPNITWTVFAKIENGKAEEALAHLQKVYKTFEPHFPFEYSFLDDKFNAQYQLENTTEKIALYFTVVAVIISCLGLFGLASFSAERRTKELGVRKVLGATVTNLLVLLCSDFVRLVTIAMIIACPIAYYAMDVFLEKYTYHTELTWLIFAAAGGMILTIALVTVTYQSLKAAMVNPVRSLRTE